MKVSILEHPTEKDWMEVKRRALVTVGKSPVSVPSENWKAEILKARHSPIRYLRFSFLLEEIPYWVSVHLVRHIHAQPYVRSQRNDRQTEYDRTKAPQDAPVTMIWDMNAEELISVCSKRLCAQSAKETRDVVKEIANKVIMYCSEFSNVLKPQCEWQGGICYEMHGGCGHQKRIDLEVADAD